MRQHLMSSKVFGENVLSFPHLMLYSSKMQSEITKKEEDSTYQIRSKVIIEEEARQKTRRGY